MVLCKAGGLGSPNSSGISADRVRTPVHSCRSILCLCSEDSIVENCQPGGRNSTARYLRIRHQDTKYVHATHRSGGSLDHTQCLDCGTLPPAPKSTRSTRSEDPQENRKYRFLSVEILSPRSDSWVDN